MNFNCNSSEILFHKWNDYSVIIYWIILVYIYIYPWILKKVYLSLKAVRYSCEMSLLRAERFQSCWSLWRDKVHQELIGIGEHKGHHGEEGRGRMEGNKPTVVLNMAAKWPLHWFRDRSWFVGIVWLLSRIKGCHMGKPSNNQS